MADNDEPRWVELASIPDPVQAELLAVFLDSTELEFRMVGLRSAPVLAALIPGAQEPVVFEIPEDQIELGRELFTDYQLMQSREFVPSEFPPPYEGEGSAEDPDAASPGDRTDTSNDES